MFAAVDAASTASVLVGGSRLLRQIVTSQSMPFTLGMLLPDPAARMLTSKGFMRSVAADMNQIFLESLAPNPRVQGNFLPIAHSAVHLPTKSPASRVPAAHRFHQSGFVPMTGSSAATALASSAGPSFVQGQSPRAAQPKKNHLCYISPASPEYVCTYLLTTHV